MCPYCIGGESIKFRILGMKRSVCAVMERCSSDGGGSTVSKVNFHTEFNQQYVQFQETIKYMHTIYNTCMPCAALDKIMVKVYNDDEN